MSTLLGLKPEVQDTCTSLGLMLLVVLFMGLARVIARQLRHRPLVHAFVLEFLATFQLCCSTHELQLLSQQDAAHPTWTLTLIYFFSLVHGLTLVGTASNPCGVMMQMMLGYVPRDGCHEVVSSAAECSVQPVLHKRPVEPGSDRVPLQREELSLQESHPHRLAQSDHHRGHLLLYFPQRPAALPRGPNQASHPPAGCAHHLFGLCRGKSNGALFNPALALSLHFMCFDKAFHQFFTVYWLAPSLGILFMILMFSFFLPRLHNNQTINKRSN